MESSRIHSALKAFACVYLFAAAIVLGTGFGFLLELVSEEYHSGYRQKPPQTFETALLLVKVTLHFAGYYLVGMAPGLAGLWWLTRSVSYLICAFFVSFSVTALSALTMFMWALLFA